MIGRQGGKTGVALPSLRSEGPFLGQIRGGPGLLCGYSAGAPPFVTGGRGSTMSVPDTPK